jgi:phosphoribosylamine---glycine ligase
MNVLLIGSGGREHALAWKLAASPCSTKLYAAPGNPGIEAGGRACRSSRSATTAVVAAFCKDKRIDLVVVGPEAPLVAGLADHLTASGIKVFGPSAKAAQLEGSKVSPSTIAAENGIPTGAYRRVHRRGSRAQVYPQRTARPSCSRPTACMGAKACRRHDARRSAGRRRSGLSAMGGKDPVVIEEFLDGEEASFFCLVDGETVVPLASAQDHKRAFDGDLGPNTGGMGAYSPAPVMTAEMERRALEEIVKPTARALARAGTPYRGVLFAGLMITKDGPKLIEYNVRFGDPECQVLMPRLKDDLLTLLLATCDGTLNRISVRWRDEHAITVVLATKGYPGDYAKGSEIRGLDRAGEVEGVTIFHAGTKQDGSHIVASGGRVLNVTATGATLQEAQARAYRAVDLIDWPGGFCRRDIGWRALNRS